MADRTRLILRAVVDQYVETASPVGSQAIADRDDVTVSSATVRNCLKYLEGLGQVVQPHVSAGRMPTDLGYRAVVQDVLGLGVAPLVLPTPEAATLEDVPGVLARLLAEVTRCMAVVSAPADESAEVVALTLVATIPGCATLVVVCDDGNVIHRTLRCTLDGEAIARVGELLRELLQGRGVPTEDEATRWLGEVDGSLRDLAARALACVEAALVRLGAASPAHAGMTGLLAQPEFTDGECTRELIQVLEDGDDWVQGLLARPSGDLLVRIGRENDDERLGAMSVVAKEYRCRGGVGLVACVGPTRMDYPRTIGAVEAVAQDAERLFDGARGVA